MFEKTKFSQDRTEWGVKSGVSSGFNMELRISSPLVADIKIFNNGKYMRGVTYTKK
jgi:hypothetical protein